MKKVFNTELNKNNINEEVTLYGWVKKQRNLGGMIFIDLRDRSGIIQLVCMPENKNYDLVKSLKNESVIKVEGKVVKKEKANNNLKTGDIEVIIKDIELLNSSEDLPFEIVDETASFEETRLKYRYLDLRRKTLSNKIITRSKIMGVTRNYFTSNDFIEIETPIFCKSTPEGARDYLVPSRVNEGKFFALPQSPQIFKQLLMVSGFERYFQIAKCFRDEDLRADRQPEFTQIDLEMSFIEQKDIILIIEKYLEKLFKEIKGIKLELPLKKMTYKDAFAKYGTDKPDLRLEMEILDLNNLKSTDFETFKYTDEINGILIKNNQDLFSRKYIEKLNEQAKSEGLEGLFVLKYEDCFKGSINKFINDDLKEKISKEFNVENNDTLIIACGSYKKVKKYLGALRLSLGKELDLINKEEYKALWVTDFPMFEYNEEENRYIAMHHPFTMINKETINYLEEDPSKCISDAYDIVINGYEVGGGSIRIHDRKLQQQIFKTIGLTEEEQQEKFGFLLEAFKYGVPPHGGLALGLDRITMLLTNTENIKDVIAFPKTASATCLMSGCPSMVTKKQLEELHIKTIK